MGKTSAKRRSGNRPRGKKTFSIVVPACNEAGNIQLLVERVRKALGDVESYEFVFVDDGSTDGTLDEIKAMHKKYGNVKFLSLSRNFGHQNALRAGLEHARGDAVLSMDADLQHPPELVPELLRLWRAGFEIVYTIRLEEGVPFFKRVTAALFYRILRAVSGLRIDPGSADFRLLDRVAVDAIRSSQEYDLFLRGFVTWVGFRNTAVPYIPEKRHAGATKYTFRRMLLFAVSGLTSFSSRPLHLTTYLGVGICLLAAAYAVYALIMLIFTNQTVAGWTSVILTVLFLGGMQLLMLGIIGEYLGKVFMESKRRPTYFIREDNF